MVETIILDTNILKDVARGNTAVANSLTRYLKGGTSVYISRTAYGELGHPRRDPATAAKNAPGQIRECDRKNDPAKPGDAFVAAQAKAINAKLWTLDKDLAKREPRFGVELAQECSLKAIRVVDLDPWSPFNATAAMVFPINDWTEEVFNTVGPTDNYSALPTYVNFSMIRWIRPANIHLLRFL